MGIEWEANDPVCLQLINHLNSVVIPANGKLYVFGGLALAWKPIGMVMEYDPAKNAWTKSWSPPAKGSCWCRVLRVCRKWRP